MAVRMRLIRMGKKKQPMYRIVVVDGRRQRDSRYIEQIGRYEPLQNPSLIEVDNERAAWWLAKGAKPSERVEKLLNISGAMTTMKVQAGKVHVVGVEKAKTEEKPAAEEAPADEPAAEAAEAPAEEPAPEAAATEEVAEEQPAEATSEEE
ncbi:MAG: 30S ribosomal protein S16 [Acidimicrobiales bacterium]|jgi:small subunit ribosomal protein S16|nr:30S ribosomal protein S16 [Acidimicrobiales bacterium]HLV91084.1 30S ribosomal protein S16 [Acidimicrobiia bacterium]